ncbi:MAG TPA: pyridoxal-phosphate dependent enzyme [Gaiellaceae bacterium]|nr:pyridoxal-phosphate dependent enzyme [Gaiellaceae bacterium]
MRRHHGQGRPADPARGRLRPRVPAHLITRDDVLAAREAIAGRLHRTPVFSSATLGPNVSLKAELFQRTGSFKPRGVLNALEALSPDERARGVIGASAGNHAQALAYCAALEGIDALLVMWRDASPAKVAATRGYGAEVDLEADGPAVLFDRLEQLVEETGRTRIDPFEGPALVVGQGTVGLEIGEDVPDVDVVVVPVGGGGLVAGIATALPGVRVVGAEPVLANALSAALDAGEPVKIHPRSVADGLNAPFAGELALQIVRERSVEVVTVEEQEIEAAMRLLYERAKLACEPAGAAAVAGLMTGKVAVEPGARVVCVVSGGNVAAETAAAILARP